MTRVTRSSSDVNNSEHVLWYQSQTIQCQCIIMCLECLLSHGGASNFLVSLSLSDLVLSLNHPLSTNHKVKFQHWFFTFTNNTETLYPLENIFCEFHDKSRWVFFSESQLQPFPRWDHESWVSRDGAVALQQLWATVLYKDCQSYFVLMLYISKHISVQNTLLRWSE